MFKFLLLAVLALSVVKADDPVYDPKTDLHALLGEFTITTTGAEGKCAPTGKAKFDTTDKENPTLIIAKWTTDCDFIAGSVTFSPIVETSKPELTFNNLLATISKTIGTGTVSIAKETINYENKKDGQVDAKWTAKFTITKEGQEKPDEYEVTFEYKGDLICLKGEFTDTEKHVCSLCEDTCTECTSATVCTACKAGYGTDKTNQVCHKCQGATFLKDQTCTACHETCGTCDNADTCLTCVDKFGLDTKTNLCVACKADEWSKENKVCTTCPQDCTTCESDQKCTDCAEGKYLPQKGGVCRECKAGEWTDTQLKICELCPDHCLTCTSNEACQTCEDRWGLVEQKGLCIACGEKQISENNACKNCDVRAIVKGNTCHACLANEVVNANATECVPCQPNEWANVNTCTTCPEGCTTCTNADTCTACAETHNLAEGKCVKKGLSGVVVALIVILIIAIIGGVAFFLYKRKQGGELRDEMDYKSVVA